MFNKARGIFENHYDGGKYDCKRILIVEDDNDINNMLRDLLMLEDYS